MYIDRVSLNVLLLTKTDDELHLKGFNKIPSEHGPALFEAVKATLAHRPLKVEFFDNGIDGALIVIKKI